MTRARLVTLVEALFVPAVVVLLAAVFALVTYLSVFAASDIKDDFNYQEAVVTAERDAGLLKFQMLDRASDGRTRGMYAKLLDDDLHRIGTLADGEDEQPPAFMLDVNRPDFSELEMKLTALDGLGRTRFESTTQRNVRIRAGANLGFALVCGLFVAGQARLRRRLARGRELVEGLQRAFLARRHSLPNVRASSILLSATAGSNVGGDVHDVFSFDGRFGMFMIADVSGKGLDAAVDTVFIKYAIRTLFSEERDPGIVLARFASLYARAAENPESFVVLFLGVIDTQSGTVRYASAGHEPAFAKRAGGVSILEPTGPIVGIFADSPYGTRELELERGDVIVLSTDGLTESRDRHGTLLGAESVAAWVGEIDADGSAMADRLAKRLRVRSRTIADDLAILSLEYAPGRTAVVEEPVREEVSGATLVSVRG